MAQKENAQPRDAELSAPSNGVHRTSIRPCVISLAGGDMPRVDSRLLAQHMEVQHRNLALLTVGQMLTAQAVAGAGDHKTAYARIKTAVQSLQTLLPMNGGASTC